MENSSSRKSKSEDFISKFARVYTPAVCYGALALALLPPLAQILFLGGTAQWGTWIYRALTFLVISCPCALVISIPLSFFAGIGGASKEGVLIKGSNYMETLSKTKYVVFDKTGTLTKGVFEVTAIHHNEMDEKELLEYAALAECASSHPISKSLQKAYGQEIERNRVSEIQEISGHGVVAKVDGREVAAGNSKLMKKLGVEYKDCHKVGTIIHIAVDGKYEGHIVISDVLKPHAEEVVSRLKKAGVKKTVMLTGDARAVAEQAAKALGIDEVYSELLPGDKVEKVEALLKQKAEKEKLAFVGDGINDAPVLTRADIGIAMGRNGTDVAKNAADMILTDDDFSTIEKAMAEGRSIYVNIKKSILFLLSSNFGEMITMFLAVLLGLPSPLKASHILWVNLITDSLPALALGVDKNNTEMLMKKMPREPKEGLFAHGGCMFTVFYGILIAGLTLYAFYLGGQTYAFTVLGVSQLFHAIGMRDQDRSVLRMNHLENPLMILAFCLGLGLQIMVTEIPYFVSLFHTARLTFEEWKLLLCISAVPLLMHELLLIPRRIFGTRKKQ